MNRVAVHTFGPHKRAFLDLVARSPTLKSLWASSDGKFEGLINCNESLPLKIRSKDEIYADVAALNKGSFGAIIKAKQGMTYAKELAGFYKSGVVAVWKNNKTVRIMKRQKYKVSGTLDRRGNEVAISIPSFNDLTKKMAQQVYIRSVEDRTYREATKNELSRAEQPSTVLFSMTRAEYQLLRRTQRDIIKLPLFAVIASVFMEMTPVLCYLFPEVTPLTCILPSILPRIWRPKDMENLRNIVNVEMKHTSVEDLSLKTAYNIPLGVLRAVALSLCLKSKYIPSILFPDSVLRSRLQAYYLYLLVDNFYLSGKNGNGNVWDLSSQELFSACQERNLIQDNKKLLKTAGSGTPQEKEQLLNELRLKLLLFISNFDSCNVGFLAVDHLLPKVETEAVLEWSKELPRKSLVA